MQRRIRERQRSEQGIDREVRKVLDTLIKKIEKTHERTVVCEDDGRPYIDQKSSKVIRGRRLNNVYKMRGLPCKEWFEVKDASLLRNGEFELELKVAVKVIRDQAAARKRTHATGHLLPTVQKIAPKREYVWVSPEEYDSNWGIIHLRYR
jgi:hypothetical protein